MPKSDLKNITLSKISSNPGRPHVLSRLLSQTLHTHRLHENFARNAVALTGALVISLAAPGFHAADAAGLEKLRVLSGLGQPLRAEIDLTASAGESDNLSVRLAPASAYAQANVEYSSALSSLRFTLDRRSNGQPYIRVSSVQPINDPYIDMLVELNWSSGRLVREYTFLLDPPELKPATEAAVAEPATPRPAPTRAPAQNQSSTISSAPAREPRAAPATTDTAGGASEGGSYRVAPGDTLLKIARANKPDGASIDQTLVALFRSNETAFEAQNINRLKAGVVMRIPDASSVQAVSSSEARNFLGAQSSDFSAYRTGLAKAVTEVPSAPAESKKEASGKVSAKLEEKSAPAPTQDQVKLSKLDKDKQSAAAAAATAATAAASNRAAEDLAAKERGLQEANTRVGLLEKNVSDLEKLIQLKNQNLADLQKQLESKGVAVPPAPPAPAAVAPAATPAAPASAPVAAAPKTAAEPAKPATMSEPPKPAATDSSFLGDLFGNPGTLYGIGAVVLGLLGFTAYRLSNKKKSGGSFEDSFLGSNSGLRANSIFGQTGGQSVDTSNSTFNSNFLPPVGQPAEHNEVDPIAEAEVYIAYGRDAQAEEILKEALRSQPERHAIQLKLLEIYAKRPDMKSFETVANELYAATGGQGSDWQQASALGRTIDPSNSLYAAVSSDAATGFVPGASTNTVTNTAPVIPAAVTPAASATASLTASSIFDTFIPNPADFKDEPMPARSMDIPPAFAPASSAIEYVQNTISSPSTLQPVLDMDLTKTEPLIPPATDPIKSDSVMDLDFNFNDSIVLPDSASIAAAAATHNPEPVTPPPVAHETPDSDDWALRSNVDFSFDLGDGTVTEILPDSPKNQPTNPDMQLTAAPMDSLLATVHIGHPVAPKADEDVDLDLSLPALPAIGSPGTGSSEATDLGASAFSSDNTLFLGDRNKMTEINLDLDQAAKTELTQDTDSEIQSLSGASNWQEMATKLDLASAYRDIGDKEGARELLDEVIKAGDSVQIDKAKELLASLG